MAANPLADTLEGMLDSEREKVESKRRPHTVAFLLAVGQFTESNQAFIVSSLRQIKLLAADLIAVSLPRSIHETAPVAQYAASSAAI